MKFIVTGLHSSGKLEVARILSSNGVKVGKLFTNLDSDPKYSPELYDRLPTDEINRIFENAAYIYFSEMNNSITNNYECLSSSEFDNCDVFVLSPNQLNNIPMKRLPDSVCFVWMDCNSSNRSDRYRAEKRQYNFKEREDLERTDLSDFVDKLYNFPDSRIIYFQNEDPQRVAAVVEIMVKFPETVDIVSKSFRS
jgi:hypothetical protein